MWFFDLDKNEQVVYPDRIIGELMLLAALVFESLHGIGKFPQEVVLVGDGEKYLSALIVPDYKALRKYASKMNINAETESELISYKRWRTYF